MFRSNADQLRTFQASGMELVAVNHAIFVYQGLIQRASGVTKEMREMGTLLQGFQQRIAEQIEPKRGDFSEELGLSKSKRKTT